MNITDLKKDVENNLESQIKRVFRDAIDNDGDFEIEADYYTHSRIDELVEKIGLEVCGMRIRSSEFTIEFEFGERYLRIPNFPLRECRIALVNDGNYYLTIDSRCLDSSWWLAITNDLYNFKDVSTETATQILNDMNKVIEFNYLTLK